MLTVGLCAAAFAEPARVALRQTLEDPPAPGTAPVGTTVIGYGAAGGESLPFHLSVDFECPDAEARPQLLVSVADTAVLTETELHAPQAMTIEVPLRQLQWLQPVKACRELPAAQESSEDSVRYFRLRSRATAFATLTCAAAGGQTEMAMTMAPLDLWLGCAAPEPAALEPDDDGLTTDLPAEN
jgi:hypothetical protein